MNKWFNVKVKYTKTMENGTIKRVSEPYLLSAVSFSEAETRIFEELGQVIRGEFEVTAIASKEYQDIFAYDDSFTWWECKVVYDFSELGSDKPKKVSHLYLVTAEDGKEAYERIHESLSSMLVDFTVPKIVCTDIVEVFPEKEYLDREISRRPLEEEEVYSPKNVVFQSEGEE